MRARVILTFFILLTAIATWAETIHLKNGRTIVADQVREKGNHYEYDIGDDSYAIPKSLVDRIDAGGLPIPSASSGGAKAIAAPPTFTPADSLANEGDLPAKIIKDGKVDPYALASLE